MYLWVCSTGHLLTVLHTQFVSSDHILIMINRHPHSFKGGVMLNGKVPVYGTQTPSTGATTDHTHPNLPLLNSLNIDSGSRLKSNSNIIHPPLDQKDW